MQFLGYKFGLKGSTYTQENTEITIYNYVYVIIFTMYVSTDTYCCVYLCYSFTLATCSLQNKLMCSCSDSLGYLKPRYSKDSESWQLDICVLYS